MNATAAQCPRLYPFAQQVVYWPFEDPAAFEASLAEQLETFREVREQIEERLVAWLKELRVRA